MDVLHMACSTFNKIKQAVATELRNLIFVKVPLNCLRGIQFDVTVLTGQVLIDWNGLESKVTCAAGQTYSCPVVITEDIMMIGCNIKIQWFEKGGLLSQLRSYFVFNHNTTITVVWQQKLPQKPKTQITDWIINIPGEVLLFLI